MIRGQTASTRRGRSDWRFPPFLLVLGLYVVALGMAAELVWYSLVTMHGKKGADFALVVYEAGGAVLHGGGLYDVQRVARDLFGPAYHLPPFAALAAAPLGLLGRDEALGVWRALSLAAHFGSLALLLRTLGVSRWSPLAPAALAVWAFFWPARFNLIAGQWDAFFLLALAGAWWAERRRRGVLAGALLALAGSVKPYPLVGLGYFATRRRWRVLLSALVGLVTLFCLAAVLAGPRQSLVFLQQVAPHLGATTAYVENQSLAGFVTRLLEPEFRPLPTQSPLVVWLSRLLLLGLVVPLGLLGLRAPKAAFAADLQYACWVGLAPIAIPAAWMHYQELLLLPFLVLAAAWYLGPGPRPGYLAWGLYGVALVLVAFGDHSTVLGPAASEFFSRRPEREAAVNQELLARFAGPAVLLLSYKLYGALLLWVLCLRAAWRATVREPWLATWYNFLPGTAGGRSAAHPPLADERKVQTAQSRVLDASRGRVTGR